MYLLRKSNICSHKSDVQKQTSASHSSTESEIISLDADLRKDGILAFDLWDVVIEVLHSSNNVPPTQKISACSALKSEPKGVADNCVPDNAHNIKLKEEGDRNVDHLSNRDRL